MIENSPMTSRPVYRQSGAPGVDDLIRAPGLEMYLRQITDPNVMQAALSRDGRTKDASAAVAAGMAKSFRPETFLAPMRAELAKGYSEGYANAAMSWFTSEAGKRVSDVEAYLARTMVEWEDQRRR